MKTCLFCRLIDGEFPGEPVFRDERAVVFRDINPQAPVHLLVIPRKHIASLAEAQVEDKDLLGHLLWVGTRLAEQEGIIGRGFRTVINTNGEAGQSVYHLHVHILGGRSMSWPPG